MAITDLTVINAAATRTGNDPVTNIDTDTTPVGVIARSNYEDLVKAQIALYPWKAASKIGQLSRIDPDEEGEPPEPWTAAYQIPTDLIELRTVKVGGVPINYEVHGDTILCDAAEDDEVIALYLWSVPEDRWPPVFKEAMIQQLEALFLRGSGERYREGEAREESAGDTFGKARNRDAQSQTARNPMSSPTLAARGAGQPPVRSTLRR